jgi:hypothetical protein
MSLGKTESSLLTFKPMTSMVSVVIFILSTNVLLGAKPKQWARELNCPELQGSNWDIAGSCPRALHFKLNKPEYNLSNADIPLSQPKCQKFQTTRPPTNPLNPQYKLAVVE